MEELIEQRLPPGVRLSPPHGHELNTRKWSTIYTSFSEEITFAMATQRSENPPKKKTEQQKQKSLRLPPFIFFERRDLAKSHSHGRLEMIFFFFLLGFFTGFRRVISVVFCFSTDLRNFLRFSILGTEFLPFFFTKIRHNDSSLLVVEKKLTFR